MFRLLLIPAASLTLLLGLGLPVHAEQCTPLPLVGGEGSEVSKEISPPTLPVPLPGPLGARIRNNWNTDWAIPGGAVYNRFVVTFIPQDTGEFNLEVHLKYSDDSSDRVYKNGRAKLTYNEPVIIEAVPRPNDQPYQVNLMAGGARSVGNSFRARVEGCR